MPVKAKQKQTVERRLPQQARARNKVELILEAAVRHIERNGIAALTTNAIAETAGISIGTLYQYFNDKEAILEALTRREMDGLSARVLKAVKATTPDVVGARVRAIIHAVLHSYGGRRHVHNRLLEYGLSRGPGTKLDPLYSELTQLLVTEGVAEAGEAPRPLRPADAFVLTYAFVGVMRAVVAAENRQAPLHELEESMTRLVVGFFQGGAVQ